MLSNKTALVTGSSKGIGKAIADMLSQSGAKVVRAEVGKRIAKIIESPTKLTNAQVIHVPVVEFS